MMLTRRSLLATATAAGAMSMWDAPLRVAFANAPTEQRFVVVILRGALDGLAAVPVHGDPDYASVRGDLALQKAGNHPLLDLDGQFGLHPSLSGMKAMWDAKELTVLHNIGSAYHDRSHFDAQNILESGGKGPHVLSDGWLNRALKPMGLADGEGALAVASTAPLILDGKAKATSWMPAALPEPDTAFLAHVRALYKHDATLASALDRAIATEAKAAAAMDDTPKSGMDMRMRAGYGDVTPLFSGAGTLLANAGGPRVAVLDVGGWDTHVNEGAGDGQLARRLRALDQGLVALKASLGPMWDKTAVMAVTEFGRTVAPNGSQGTDHGTAGAAFLLGGAVAGGAVMADWVGLKPAALQDGRDLPVRTDMRALFKAALGDHMRVASRELEAAIFPDSAEVHPLKGLFRA